MDKAKFIEELEKQSSKIKINLTNKQTEQFYLYMKLLLDWNEKINLTAITEPSEIIKKHFIDSLTINPYIEETSKVIDVGTGAGFPGIPIKIIKENSEIVLLDSLNKRIKFLEEVINQTKLSNIKTIHYRAEEAGKNKIYREKFDIATSRAVASLNVLLEYLLPLIKIGGRCICMKGNNIKEEIEQSKNAIKTLGGELEKIEGFTLPDSDIERNIIIVKKIKETPTRYPRKAGTPSKEPIIG